MEVNDESIFNANNSADLSSVNQRDKTKSIICRFEKKQINIPNLFVGRMTEASDSDPSERVGVVVKSTTLIENQ